MKSGKANIFMELLEKSIEEPIQRNDTRLTKEIIDEPIFLVKEDNSPLLFTFGWDPDEKFNVLSLN